MKEKKKLRLQFIFILGLAFIFYNISLSSAMNGWIHDLSQEERYNLYHSREREEKTFNESHWMSYPKKREGGLGPGLTVEVSAWVKSLEYVRRLPEGSSYEFVFNVEEGSTYIGIPSSKSPGGHCYIASCASIGRGCGGNISRIEGNLFRTDEGSGHFGPYWNNSRRFKFIEAMFHSGLEVLHEPWCLDRVRIKENPEGFAKALNFETLEEKDYPKGDPLFPKLAIEEIRIYQNNFLRIFGNSLLNPSIFFIGVWRPAHSPSYERLLNSPYYEQKDKSIPYFQLKPEFRSKGKLDMDFYDPDEGFISPDEMENFILDYYTKKYF